MAKGSDLIRLWEKEKEHLPLAISQELACQNPGHLLKPFSSSAVLTHRQHHGLLSCGCEKARPSAPLLTSHVPSKSSCLISSAAALTAWPLLRLSTVLFQSKPWSSLPGANTVASSLSTLPSEGAFKKGRCDQYLQFCPWDKSSDPYNVPARLAHSSLSPHAPDVIVPLFSLLGRGPVVLLCLLRHVFCLPPGQRTSSCPSPEPLSSAVLLLVCSRAETPLSVRSSPHGSQHGAWALIMVYWMNECKKI